MNSPKDNPLLPEIHGQEGQHRKRLRDENGVARTPRDSGSYDQSEPKAYEPYNLTPLQNRLVEYLKPHMHGTIGGTGSRSVHLLQLIG
jgi:hypothetical protein